MTPHNAFPDVTWADIRAELQREIAHRRATFPGMVAKGRMTQADADRELAVFSAMIEPEGKNFTWHDRRAALMRELDYRARLYPGWIQKGRITRENADAYTHRLACLLALYEAGYHWRARNGLRPNMWPPENGTPEEREARLEWYALQVDVHHRAGNIPMRDGTVRIISMINPSAADAIAAQIASREGTAQKELAV